MSTPGEWKLVEDLGELRPGLAVKDIACKRCGSECVAFVRRWIPGHMLESDMDSWELTPECRPPRRPGRLFIVNETTIRERRIFRLITGNDSSAEQEEGRRDADPVERHRMLTLRAMALEPGSNGIVKLDR